MNTDFPRILTLLRKEKGISQKEAAAQLGISQALLSHYEKGIRECGLQFLVQCSKFYGVSCDYLLGLSPERDGRQLTMEDLPEPDEGKDVVYRGNIMPVLNKKLLLNSINILYDLISKSESTALNQEVSAYLMMAAYQMFRVVYSANPKNEASMFSIPAHLSDGYGKAAMDLAHSRASQAARGLGGKKGGKIHHINEVRLTTEYLSQAYPRYAQSLFNLIQNAENKMDFDRE